MVERKERRTNVSIKWKIFLFLMIFCVLLLVILWLFQTVFLEQFYTSIKLSQVEDEATHLAALIEKGDTASFESRIRQRGDLYVELVSADGQSTPVDGFFPEFAMGLWSTAQRQALYEDTLAAGGSLSERYDAADMPQPGGDAFPGKGGTQPPAGEGAGNGGKRPDGERGRWGGDSVLHAKIVNTPAGREYMLLVRAVITPVNATVEALRMQLWVISAIMLVLAVGIALLIAKRVAKPIEKLNRSAAELGRGNYGVTFEAGGYREVAELAGTLNHAATELERTEELRRDLIANVSHDLRTPLTLITGYAEMIRDIPGENTPENMQVIIDEARRLSSLVKDLLDLSQLQSGTSRLELAHFNLTEEIESVIGRFSRLGGGEGCTVRFENNNGEVWVRADEHRIVQVVYNFLINAMTHGGEDQCITVRQVVEGARVRVEVADTGPGIPAGQLPYIWDRYYKVDKVRRRSAAGAGLGLSIVKSILEQHPGMQYGVTSPLGGGSTFWFSLPRAD